MLSDYFREGRHPEVIFDLRYCSRGQVTIHNNSLGNTLEFFVVNFLWVPTSRRNADFTQIPFQCNLLMVYDGQG